MNVLVANISIFPYKREELVYNILLEECDVKVVRAYQTNESIFKSLIELRQIKESGGLGKIIALVSNKAKTEKNAAYNNQTSFEYYKSIVSQLSPDTNFDKDVELEDNDGNERPVHVILNELCSKIDPTDVVYLDSAGGKRTTGNVIQLLTKLLKYKGIRNPYSLYADINGKLNLISDTADFVRMTELADAFNEFMTSGKSKQLYVCFENEQSADIKSLLSVMTEFSDRIQLGNIEGIDQTVVKLNDCIEKMNTCDNASSIESVILKQFLPVIKEKLIGTSDKVDYLKIIRWCLDNTLVQQALTIFVEKIPVYLFEHGIIKYCGDVVNARRKYEENRDKMKPFDWETEVFYSEILDSEAAEVKELRTYLSDGKMPKNEKGLKIVKILKKIENTWSPYVEKIEIPKEFACLRDFIKSGKFKNFSKFKSVLFANKKLCNRLIGIEQESVDSDDTFVKKFISIQRLKEGFRPNSIVFKAPIEEIVKIYYGYIYVKALRNQTNHASSNENLSEKQKFILQDEGFNLSENTVSTVINNIRYSLDIIESADLKLKNIEKAEESEPIVPTNLKVGDIVSVLCTNRKIVRIDGYNYNIQLNLPKFKEPDNFLNRTFDVKIKQISKSGKICQVELLD